MKYYRYILTILAALLLFAASAPLSAQGIESEPEYRDDDTLNFTYIGPVVSAGIINARYTDWFDTETKSKSMSGMFYSGGAAVEIFAGSFCGDFQIKYIYNSLDFTLMYLETSIAGKYLYPVNSWFSAGGGLGFYFASPPSNMDYNGSAGIMLPVTAVFTTTPTTKLFVDIYAGYGSFGIGEETSSISAGIRAGFVFKVGRI
ncbi:MAG TPA: hypothetical protein PK514_15340 [Spirochaetota bacterium]|nr:hypothetical protein [Spirochaetota bacterium]